MRYQYFNLGKYLMRFEVEFQLLLVALFLRAVSFATLLRRKPALDSKTWPAYFKSSVEDVLRALQLYGVLLSLGLHCSGKIS